MNAFFCGGGGRPKFVFKASTDLLLADKMRPKHKFTSNYKHQEEEQIIRTLMLTDTKAQVLWSVVFSVY